MIPIRAALLAAIGALSLAAGAAANDVTLTSSDGAIELSGRLLGYDGDIYRVETEFGTLAVSADAVICTGALCPEPGRFVAEWRITGTRPAVDVLMPALLEAFAAQASLDFARTEEDADTFSYALRTPDDDAVVARIHFQVDSAANAFGDLADGTTDIAVASREPDATELQTATGGGITNVQSRLLALDGLVAVVAPTSARDDITPAELAALIGQPGETAVHLPAEATSVARALARLLLVPTGTSINGAANRHETPEMLASAIAANPDAIGVTLQSEASGLRALPLTGSCGARIPAEQQQIKAEDYPLTVPHYLYLSGRRMPVMARDFLSFTASPIAQQIVRDAGFTDQSIESTPLNQKGDRLARAILNTGEDVGAAALRRMVRELSGAERLTPTFRFTDGSADLDAPSRANITLVAQAISDGTLDGDTLLVAGFSDSLGPGSANLALSSERANAVRVALEAALTPDARERVTLVSEGFGEASPIACDDDAWGRSINRRVELWRR